MITVTCDKCGGKTKLTTNDGYGFFCDNCDQVININVALSGIIEKLAQLENELEANKKYAFLKN